MTGAAGAVVFWVCALGSVATGFAVFRVSSMARATFALLASFVLAAIDIALLQLSYLAVVVILMMIMEMAVMAVFMLMYMMNPAGLMPMQMYHNKAGSMTLAVGTFVVLAAGILLVDWPTRDGTPPPDVTLALGEALMGSKMLVMVVVGLVLLTTIVASVVLATDRGRYDRFGDDLDAARADDPIPGGVGR
ncbi:NADH-quinone oxidoreductase subunit J [Rhodococcus aerolatus]